jgi:hypothetical protein
MGRSPSWTARWISLLPGFSTTEFVQCHGRLQQSPRQVASRVCLPVTPELPDWC